MPEGPFADGLAETAWGSRGASKPRGLLLKLPWPPAACCLLGSDVGTRASCLGLSPAVP